MRKILKPGAFLFLLISSIFLTTCDIFEDADDPCNDTDFKISKTRSITVSTSWLSDDNNSININDLDVRIEFHKIACGFDEYKPGGDFTFTGVTNEDGVYTSGRVNYNIRNSNDRIILIISRQRNGIWEQVEYEEFSYREDDFGNDGTWNSLIGYTFFL
ncbi:MAG: hypothetical protein ABFS16_06115 [Bacteroidota bacterium]